MVKTKLISSMEKCFLDEDIEQKKRSDELFLCRNEAFAFQLAYTSTQGCDTLEISVKGDLSEKIKVRNVDCVYVDIPASADADDNYLRKEPGLYPDLLSPIGYGGHRLFSEYGRLKTVWISYEPGKNEPLPPPGDYTIAVELTCGGITVATEKLTVHLGKGLLKKQTTVVTQWLHCDCLANYYNVEPFSNEHFKIIEKFIKTAVANGINTAYVPLFTPPLDTAMGGERTTTQLVMVKRTANEYRIDLKNLGRFIDICINAGVEYFEFSHLFTQWGARHAPKVEAAIGRGAGIKCKVFGWETDATSNEYISFLRQVITSLKAYIKRKRIEDRCLFHISDEPPTGCIEGYIRAKNAVASFLEGFTILDALSDIDLYRRGAVTLPVPSVDRIEPFVKSGIKPLWTYYCSAQGRNVPNRMMSMNGARTRIMGILMYKYDIDGFLHWGYNFYNNRGSCDAINPYTDTCGGHWVPGGDTFSVYPGLGGEALESMRIRQFYDGLQDIRALQLCEEKIGREETLDLLHEGLNYELSFEKYPKNEDYILELRRKINIVLNEQR